MKLWGVLLVTALCACSREPQRPLAFQCGRVNCSLACPAGDTCTEKNLVACRRQPNGQQAYCYVTMDVCQKDILTEGECHMFTLSDYLAR
jgi:hypothetical protein